MNKFSMVVLAALAASGCSTQTIRDTQNLADGQNRIASKVVAGAQSEVARKAGETSDVVSGIWIGGRVVKQVRGALPEEFAHSVTLNEHFETLNALAERLTGLVGIPVRLSPEVGPYPRMGASQSGGGATSPLPGGSPGGSPAIPMIQGIGGSTMHRSVHVDFSGPLAKLLDVVAAQYGTHWRYVAGSILFYNLETRTFVLDAVPGDASLSANVAGGATSGGAGGGSSGGSSSGGATGGAGASAAGGGSAGGATSGSGVSGGSAGGSGGDSSGSMTSVSSTLSVWNDIKSAVNSMLSSTGHAVVTPATGTIMVTDDPVYVDRIAEYVDAENAILSKQVLLEVKVLSISRTGADQYGINWNTVFNSLSKNVGITATNAFPTTPGVGSLAFNILSTAGANNPAADIRQFAGSSAIINALSTQGDVSLVTSSTIVTLNNQPVPIQIGTQTSYLASVSNTVTANVGSTSSLSPGVVQTGFNMDLLPHLLSGRRLMLQFAVNISSLNKLSTITSGGQTIQIPEVNSRDFLQRVSMNSGETLLLSGFEQTSANLSKQGIGSADNVALGGGVSATKTRDIVVIMITPVIAQKVTQPKVF